MSEIITCPSGLQVRIRGMKAREERILADRKLARSGGQLDQVLKACTEELVDAGPYAFAGDDVDWSRVLQGDRFFALLQVRVLSYGPEYAFSVPCEERACRARIEWELDLTELPVRPLSDESRAAFLAGNRFETVLPDAGKRVVFRLMTGADEQKLTRLRRQAGDRPITTMLGFRIDEIEGVEARDKLRFVEDLAMADVTHLLGELDRVDCGVETEIDVECPECLATQPVELPFDRGFFLPDPRRDRKRSSRR